jgi:phasin family protein
MTNPTNPFADLGKMLEGFKLPGVDMSALMKARQDDMAALMEANKATYAAMQAMAAKQADMFKEAMRDMQATAQGAMANAGKIDPAVAMAKAKASGEKTLADMQELAQMAQKAQGEALAVFQQRAAEGMKAFKDLGKK